MGSQQVALDAQQIPATRREVQDRFQTDVFLHQIGGGPGAHAHSGQRAVGDIEEVGSRLAQHARSGQQPFGGHAFGRVHLHGQHQLAVLQVLRQPRRLAGRGHGLLRPAHDVDFRQQVASGAGGVQCLAHGADVGCRCAATAADEVDARLGEGPRVVAEVIGRGRIHHPAAGHLFRPAGVGRGRDGQVGGQLAHNADQPQHLGRAAATVNAHSIHVQLGQVRRQHVGRVAEQRLVVAGEGHLGHDRQVGGHGPRRGDGRFDLLNVRHRLDEDEIDTRRFGRGQRLDLFGKGRLGFGEGDAPQRSQPHAQRADGAGQQYFPERAGDDPPGHGHCGAVDRPDLLLQAVLGQFETIGAKGIGLDQV